MCPVSNPNRPLFGVVERVRWEPYGVAEVIVKWLDGSRSSFMPGGSNVSEDLSRLRFLHLPASLSPEVVEQWLSTDEPAAP